MQVPYTQGQGYGAGNAASVDPIISRLRPRDMMGILDQAFRLYRRHFLTFLAIIAIVHVPIQLLIQALTISLFGSIYGQMDPYSRGFAQQPVGPGSINSLFASSLVLGGA